MQLLYLFNRVSVKEKAFLARQLATMLNSGLNLDKSLLILNSQVKNQFLKKSLQDIYNDLEAGNPFSSSLKKHPKIFDRIFVNVVVSGEAVGKMAEVLERLADQLEKENTFVSKIRTAAYYPTFIIVIMMILAGYMAVNVIPPLKSVFSEFNTQLPWATQTLINLTDYAIANWPVMLMIMILLVLGLLYFVKSKYGKAILDYSAIHYTAGLGIDVYMARFARTLSMLVQSGTPIIEAIDITSEVIGNSLYKKTLKRVCAQVERGVPMSVQLEKSGDFPVIIPQMISVGEKTGQLEHVLENLAKFYEEEADNKIKGVTSLFEPVIIVIIGLGVFFLVYSIIKPIYDIAQLG